jgi:hypothetical protein
MRSWGVYVTTNRNYNTRKSNNFIADNSVSDSFSIFLADSNPANSTNDFTSK